MKESDLSIGEALVELLEGYGVDTVFGIPGVHNVELYRALPRSGIRHILPRHEQGAGFMADGYARATGKPGVCFTITGPGLTNIMTPLGQAWSDSIPMLVISSTLDVDDSGQGRGRLHEMISQLGAARSVAALAATCYTARDIQDRLAEAFTMFSCARPRPAYIEIPLDVLKQPAGSGWTPRTVPALPRAAPKEITGFASRLADAERPVIILGGGGRHAGPAAQEVAEKTGAIIFTTIAAKGAVPDAHPLLAGAVLPDPASTAIIAGADVVLAVGTELSETDLWDQTFDVPGRLLRIDIDPASLARPYPPDLAIVSDARAALSALAGALSEGSKVDQRKDEVARLRAACIEARGERRQQIATVLATIREALPEDAVVASDMTQIAYAANEILPFNRPDCYLHPAGFGTLGYALPAAIGARVGVENRGVAVLVGDYGFQYTSNELATAAELGLPLVIILWNNDALAQIRDDMVRKGIQPNGVTLLNPDFAILAEACGCGSARPQSLDALETAIREALQADRPVLIEVRPTMVTS